MTNNNWQVKRLDEVATVTMGQSPPSSSYNDSGAGVPFFQGKPPNIDNFGVAIPNQYTTEPTKVVTAGTALMTVRAPVGDLFTTPTDVCIGRGLSGIKAENGVSQKYLNYQLQYASQQFHSLSQGSTFTAINSSDLKGIQVAIPPKESQEKIADILSSVDEAIQKTDQIIQKTQNLKNGLMSELLISKKYQKKSLADVILFSQYGLSIKSSSEGQYPMLRMNNYLDGKIVPYPLVYVDLSDKDFEIYKLKKGDILFNRTNSHELVGKTGIFDLDGNYVFASYLVRLRVNPQIISPEFLTYYMNSHEGKSQIESLKTRGVSQSNINPTNLRNNFKCPVPTLSEQSTIVNILRDIDRKIDFEIRQKDFLQKLKTGLMQDIFSQKVAIN